MLQFFNPSISQSLFFIHSFVYPPLPSCPHEYSLEMSTSLPTGVRRIPSSQSSNLKSDILSKAPDPDIQENGKHKLVNEQTAKDVWVLLVVFRIFNSFLVKTFFQPDEYFQSLEPAWQMAFGTDSGAWLTWVCGPSFSFLAVDSKPASFFEDWGEGMRCFAYINMKVATTAVAPREGQRSVTSMIL